MLDRFSGFPPSLLKSGPVSAQSSPVAPATSTTLAGRSDLILLILLALLALGYFVRTELQITGGRLGVPLDDAYIHYQFARNLANGDGFSYNPGRPMPGSTAPLWTLLLAAVGLFTDDFILPSLLLSAFFLALTAWLTYGFTLELAGRRWPAVLAAVGVILCGRFLWAGLAGMETTAFAATSLAAVWLYHRQGLRPLPTLLFALASQLRPEGHALFALALAGYLLANRADLGRTLRHLFIPLLLYTLVTLPYTLFSLSVTSHPLPNTFYAKAGSQYLFSLRSLRETLAYHWQDNPVAFFLIPFGLLPTARRSRLVAAWLLALPLLTAFIVDLIWHHGRYTLPLVPFQIITAALGAQWLVDVLPITYSVKRFNTQYAIRNTFILFFVAAGVYRLPYWAGMLGYNSNEILEIDVALGHWLAENTPADALIAVDDIGAITFIAQRPIFDLQGLVSPEMWPITRAEAEGLPRNQATTRLLSTVRPDYLAIFPVWHWELATNPAVATPIQRFSVETHSIIFDQEAMVYQPHWPYLTDAAPQARLQANLGKAIQLQGYDLTLPIDDSQPLSLTLYWRSLAAVTESYDVFIHVIGPDGVIVAQADQQPVSGLAPTNRWQPGDLIRDPYELSFPAGLSPGRYRIQTGLYLRETGARLPVVGGEAADNAISLATFNWP